MANVCKSAVTATLFVRAAYNCDKYNVTIIQCSALFFVVQINLSVVLSAHIYTHIDWYWPILTSKHTTVYRSYLKNSFVIYGLLKIWTKHKRLFKITLVHLGMFTGEKRKYACIIQLKLWAMLLSGKTATTTATAYTQCHFIAVHVLLIIIVNLYLYMLLIRLDIYWLYFILLNARASV